MYLCGGLSQTLGDYNRHFNDTWTSQDGEHWSQMSATAEWRPRSSSALVAYNRKLYLCAGVGQDSVRMSDVWRSTDGVTWSVLAPGGFSARYSHCVVSAVHTIYLVGGYDHGLNYRSDVWQAQEDPDDIEWQHHRFCACCNGQDESKEGGKSSYESDEYAEG